MGRNPLAGQAGDAIKAVLAAAGSNFRRLLAWLSLLLSAISIALTAQSRSKPAHKILYDIQGYEMEMLSGCTSSLATRIIDYCFISTHSQSLHIQVEDYLRLAGYRIEVSSDVGHHTTSTDGFVFASNPAIPCVFRDFKPLGREEIIC